MRVIDSQVHVWEPQSVTTPWRVPEAAALHRSRPIDGAQLVAEMDEAGVDQAVLCPPFFVGFDNGYAIEQATHWPNRFRVMARVDLDDPDRWVADPATAHELVSGIRLLFVPPDAGALTDRLDSWIWDWCGANDTPIMLIAPGQTAAIGALAKRHPHLRFTIDHLGLRPGSTDLDVITADIDALLQLSICSNVSVKASSLPCFSDDAYPYPVLHSLVRRVIEEFGERRVFWGSDLSRLRGSYAECLDMFAVAIDLSDEAREEILGRGLARWLRWDNESLGSEKEG